jgi:hypothetical protein
MATRKTRKTSSKFVPFKFTVVANTPNAQGVLEMPGADRETVRRTLRQLAAVSAGVKPTHLVG